MYHALATTAALAARPHLPQGAARPGLYSGFRVTAVDPTEPQLDAPEHLIARVAADRDREAFGAIFRLFAPKVRSFALRRGAAGAQAEEVVQEVMLAVWRRAETFDPTRANLATWIYAIARNRMLDDLRRASVPLLGEDEAGEEAAEEPDHEARLDGERDAARLRRALADLPPEQSEVIRIAYYEGLSQRDLADRLGLPLGTVKSRTRLALDRLRSAMKAKV